MQIRNSQIYVANIWRLGFSAILWKVRGKYPNFPKYFSPPAQEVPEIPERWLGGC